MDYLGRELERQRAALTALLLGGGEGRDGEAVRDGERRGLAGPAAAGRRAAGLAGRYAGGGYGGGLGAWEMVREAGQDHGAQNAGRIEETESVWEEILDGSESGGALERERRGMETAALAGPVWAARGEASGPLSGGTGARAGSSRPSGGYEARRVERGMTAGETAGTMADMAEGTAGRRRAGERPAEWRPVRGGGAESGVAGGRIGWMPEAGQAGPIRRSAGGMGPRGQDGLRAFRGTGEAGGTGPWDGPGETAVFRTEDSARALSRAVQRDARRYDGGFTIY